MVRSWTSQQVTELATDSGSLKSAGGLATATKWQTLGRSEGAIWGEIKGSGAMPYQVRIDLSEPAFKCSCPSRKFPCKHSLALFLIFAEKPGELAEGNLPGWVGDWLADRQNRQEKKAAQAKKSEVPADPAAQVRRAAKREEKVQAGAEALSIWLRDLVRNGLAAAQSQPISYWEETAARMVDAQASGLARQVRLLAELVVSGEGWQERLLAGIGRLHMQLEAYRRLDALALELQLEVRSAIGWSQSREEVLEQPGVRDRWLVLGQRMEEEDRLRVQRTWLWGSEFGQPALVLAFAAGSQTFGESYIIGSSFDGEVVYYPGSLRLRALVKDRSGRAEPISGEISGSTTIEESLARYAQALTQCPWLESWPMVLARVHPTVDASPPGQERWSLIEDSGFTLPISQRFEHGWHLAAVSGGEPIGLFGEWDGEQLMPWSAWSQGRFLTLVRSEGGMTLARVA